MHVIVLHERQLSETETDIDICVCGNTRDLVSSHPLPRAHFTLFGFSFSIEVAAEALKRKSCTDVAYFKG